MTYQKRQVAVTIPTSIPFQSNDDKALWALVNDALRRGEDVTARIMGINTALDYRTLAQRGTDEQGLPVFGVDAGTRIALTLQLTIDVSTPRPEEQPEQAAPQEQPLLEQPK